MTSPRTRSQTRRRLRRRHAPACISQTTRSDSCEQVKRPGTKEQNKGGRARWKESPIPRLEVADSAANGPQAGPPEVEERTRSSTHDLLSPPNHYPTTLATLPRPAQRHHPADATGTSRPHSPDHARSQREQWRHPTISHRNRCARTVKRPGGPVPALLQNSEIDLFTHSPFASRPLTHSHGAPFGGALRAR